MDCLKKNLGVIQKRWPHIADVLSAAPALRAEIVHDGPLSTLLIDGIHLSSSYDRESEAQVQASLIPQESAEAWIYGVGLGDLPRVLLRRSALKRLHVVLLNPAVALCSFSSFSHDDWLEDERVRLLSAAQQPTVCFPFAAVPSCLHLADDASSRIRDLLHLELSTPYIRKRHASANPEIRARLEENRPFLEADGDAAELFGRFAGKTVLVAGAGPTLSEHYDRLRSRTSPLIAVDAALRPLTQAGIAPDVVLSIDAKPQVSRFFSEADLSLCRCASLVYFPTVHRSVLEQWPGPRFAAYSSSPLFDALRTSLPKAVLFSAGSVIHPAVDLAVRMGAARVVLLGADFAFPGGSSHVAGAVVARPVKAGSDWVLDGQGQRIATAPNLRGYLRDLEAYIARQPQVRFINGSVRGARIEGALPMETLHDY